MVPNHKNYRKNCYPHIPMKILPEMGVGQKSSFVQMDCAEPKHIPALLSVNDLEKVS